MDTLISIGTLAAWSWSLVALVLDEGELYFEVASVVTVFILMGRYFEARAKRRAGAALKALLELGAKDVASSARTARSGACPSRSCASAICSSSGPGRRSPRTA